MVKGKTLEQRIVNNISDESQHGDIGNMDHLNQLSGMEDENHQCIHYPPFTDEWHQTKGVCRIRDDQYQILVQAMHQFVKDLVPYDSALYEIAQYASHLFNANCQIRLFSENRDSLILSAIHNHDPNIFQGKEISLDDFTLSMLRNEHGENWLEKNIPLMISDAAAANKRKETFKFFWPFEKQQPLSSLMVVPIYTENISLGILILIRYEDGSVIFSQEDLCFACNFAAFAGDAIKLAEKFKVLQSQLAEQKMDLLAVKQKEQRFRQVFESSSDAVFICEKDGIIIDANTAAQKQFGYTRKEFLKQDISIISYDYLSLNFNADEGDLSQYDGEPFECLTRQKNGESIYTEIIIQPIAQGRKTIYQVNARDISERVQTQNRLKTQMNHLHAIRAIDLVMKSSEELQAILDFILNQIKLELDVDAVALLLMDENLSLLNCISSQGLKEMSQKKYVPDLEESFAGQIVKNHKIIYRNNLSEDEAGKFPDSFFNDKLKSYCGVPLLINEKLVGLIEVFSRDKSDLNYEWINYLETLAGHAAIAIENFRLFSDLKQSNNELLQAYDATIEGWSRALDLRDNETEGHTQRVMELTIALAKEAGCSDEEIVHIRRGALLHDIGKIGIPDSILLKPGKLDEDEWVIMKKHPQYAYDMLSEIEYLRPALDIPFCHHEKWDGTGYPRGLEGDDIPFTARLFAVVDVWDALRSDRSYRMGWPVEDVYAYIKENNGSHFDPHAVELFFKILHKQNHGTK
jgi:PAS domain S-box-containing protein